MTTDSLPTLEEMTDILDIEGIFRFPLDQILLYGGIILAVLALCALIFFLVWWLRRRAILRREKELSPNEKFFLELERLDNQKLLKRNDYRKYYFFLSEIFRQYLTDSFGCDAIDKTTEEILPLLSDQIKLPEKQQVIAKDFLAHADLVKFAKIIPEEARVASEREGLVEFVKTTTIDCLSDGALASA